LDSAWPGTPVAHLAFETDTYFTTIDCRRWQTLPGYNRAEQPHPPTNAARTAATRCRCLRS